MSIKDFVEKGVTFRDSYGHLVETSDRAINFQNGWRATICRYPNKEGYEFSLGICDVDGYFDWNILKQFGANEKGVLFCLNEEEVCKHLDEIKNLPFKH